MSTEMSEDTATEYFATLNPIARKISIDIDETKSNYEHIWNQLSPTEQTDIINETLIRPEIALRYFDNFSSSSSSVTLSNAGEDGDEDDEEEEEEAYRRRAPAPIEEAKLKKSCDKFNTKNIYSYDGKNIWSFSGQKTGSRVVNDEVIGVFRDEHSAPFSYKTKSQINLKLFSDSNANCKTTEVQQALVQLQKFQKLSQPTKTGNHPGKGPHHHVESKGFDKIDGIATGNYERFYNDQKISNNLNNLALLMDSTTLGAVVPPPDAEDVKGNFLSKFICKNSMIFNAGTNLIIKANQVATGQSSIGEEDEGLNLIKNVSYSGLTSSSSVPSEEEEEKQICEDSKLLLENDELRKGFDFLNNW